MIPSLGAYLRRKLLRWMLLPGIMFVLALGLVTGWWGYREAGIDLTRASSSITRFVSVYVEDAEELLMALAGEVDPLMPSETIGRLQNIQRLSSRFTRLLWVDAGGRILADSPYGKEGLDFPVLFPRRGDGWENFSKPIYSSETGMLTVYIRQPTVGGGMLVGELDLTELRRQLGRVTYFSTPSVVLVTDAFGNVISSDDDILFRQQANIGHWPIFRSERATGGGLEVCKWQDESYLCHLEEVDVAQWIVLTGVPLSFIFRPAMQFVFVVLGSLFTLFIILSIFVDREMRRDISQPLKRLVTFIRNVGAGNYDEASVESRRFVELAQIEEQFSLMLEKVRDREMLLKKSEEKYRNIFENSMEGIYQCTSTGRIASANPTMAHLLGHASVAGLMDSVQDMRLDVYMDSDEAMRLEEKVRRKGSVADVETRFRRTDGNYIWVEQSIRGVFDNSGQLVMIEGMVQDVTSRKHAQEALHRQMQLDASLAELAAMVLSTTDIRSISEAMLEKARALTGATAGYVGYIESRNRWLVCPAMHVPKSMNRCIPAEGDAVFKEYCGLWGWGVEHGEEVVTNDPAGDERSGGTPDWHLPLYNFASAPAMLGDEVVGQVALANVAGEFTPADEEVVRRMAALFAIGLQRRRTEKELRQAKEKAETASEAKSQFLANISHELRTPLNGILGMLQLMHKDAMDREDREYANLAEASAQSLLSIIADLLNLAKIEAGVITVEERRFSLSDMLETVMKSFTIQAEDRLLELSWNSDGQVPDTLVGDEGKIRQVVVNLVGNSVKFTRTGSVRVAVSLLPHKNADGKSMVCFCISDTGIGIPDDKVGHIFNPFTQVDGTYTRKHGGAGLGLGIVRRLVDLLGGTLCVDSKLGEGTSILFTCWVELPECAGEQTCVNPQEALPQGLEVLLVEDDRVNRLTATRFLQRLGCRVTSSENGREAVEKMEKQHFDCVFMDIQMPVMDGITATRAIREMDDPARRKVPIVALTAHAMVGDRESFLKAGMNSYLSKPLDIDALSRVLLEMLQENE